MAKKETDIQNMIRVEASERGFVTFRNTMGFGYMGKLVKPMCGGGLTVLKDARPVSFGLMVGSGDLIGWKEIEITPDMVGKKIAQFVSFEVKTKEGRVSTEQKIWHENVNEAGGLSKILRSPDDLP